MLFMLPMTAKASDYTDYYVPDTLQWSLTTMDGNTITDKTYDRKFQLYMFINAVGCLNSTSAVKGIANREWLTNNDIQVIVIFDDNSTMS